MTESVPTIQANRRDLLRGGALGIGTVAGGLALSGASAAPAAAASPLTGAPIAALASGGPARYFLEIAGIPGESQDSQHPNWLEVFSYSWGASAAATTTTTGGGGGAGKASVTDLVVSAALSQASPQLFLSVMNGKVISTATLEGVRQSGDADPVPFVRLSLESVLVTAYESSGSEETPTDEFSLAFGRITYSYWPQMRDGSLGDEQAVRWDVKAAKTF